MTSRLRAVAQATAIFFAIVAVGPAVADDGAPSSFRVENAKLDLGSVVAGSVVTATFVFHNDGTEDVHIIRAKPS